MIKELQKNAVFRSADMAAAHLVSAQADAMKAAASNTSTGPMMAFAGMNMANAAGGANTTALYGMAQQQQMQNQQYGGYQQGMPQQGYQQGMPQQGYQQGMPQQGYQQGMPQQGYQQGMPQQGYQQQGQAQPEQAGGFVGQVGGQQGVSAAADADWVCGCGQHNTTKFCSNCGSKKPEAAGGFKCDKCGWTPAPGAAAPKFCPDCGDIFDENDKI